MGEGAAVIALPEHADELSDIKNFSGKTIATVRMSTGDVIGFLHADDLYAHDRVIERVAAGIVTARTDSCYGDLVYVKRDDTDRIIRYWKIFYCKKNPGEDELI